MQVNFHYDPTTGTFLTRDPLDGVDGTPTVANPYHYVDNDPLNKIDPEGLRPTDSDFGGCGSSSGSQAREPGSNSSEQGAVHNPTFCDIGQEPVVSNGTTYYQYGAPIPPQPELQRLLDEAGTKVRNAQMAEPLKDRGWSATDDVVALVTHCKAAAGKQCNWFYGGSVNVGYFDGDERKIYIHEQAIVGNFRLPLVDVVAHEIGHAMMNYRLPTTESGKNETYADCLAIRWGFTGGYGGCSQTDMEAAVRVMQRPSSSTTTTSTSSSSIPR